MKKILYFVSLLAITFTACDPMEDTYDELDKENDKAFYETRTELKEDYTLVDKDYELSENDDVKKFKSFSKTVKASEFVPAILDAKLIYGQPGAEFNISYKLYQGSLSYLKDLIKFKDDLAKVKTKYTLTKADYDSMGTEKGKPGEHDNFSSSTPASKYLPTFLKVKYPSAVKDFWVEITYKFYSGSVKTIKEVWAYNGTKWGIASPVAPSGVKLYELIAEDYDSMGEPGAHDNFSASVKPEDYLPKFLTIKAPFAYSKQNAKVAILYRFYKGKIEGKHTTVWEAKEFTFDGSVWKEYKSTVVASTKYTFKNKKWAYVPPIKMVKTDKAPNKAPYTLTDSDYELVGNGRFKNFDIRAGKPDESEAVRIAKLTTILKAKGVSIGDVYEVTYKAFNGTATVDMKIKLEAVADN